jgi:hypothetical protein
MLKKLILILLSLALISELVLGCTPATVTVTNTVTVTSTPSTPSFLEEFESQIVYVNRNETVYHYEGCVLLNESAIPFTQREVNARHYKLCQICLQSDIDDMYRMESVVEETATP